MTTVPLTCPACLAAATYLKGPCVYSASDAARASVIHVLAAVWDREIDDVVADLCDACADLLDAKAG